MGTRTIDTSDAQAFPPDDVDEVPREPTPPPPPAEADAGRELEPSACVESAQLAVVAYAIRGVSEALEALAPLPAGAPFICVLQRVAKDLDQVVLDLEELEKACADVEGGQAP